MYRHIFVRTWSQLSAPSLLDRYPSVISNHLLTSYKPRIVRLLDKHHTHLNQKSALTFGSSDYGAYLTQCLQGYYVGPPKG